MINLKKFSTSIFAATLVSSIAFAWGDLGHQTVGEIAQRNLTPQGKRLVEEILGHGPLAEAATFPDLVRSDEDYKEFASFHFVEIDPRYEGSYDKIPLALREKIDANSIIAGVPQKLFKGLFFQTFSRAQKMDLLRYLVHLVGDVHQPLHVGNGYDRGANWCDVKYKVGKGDKVQVKSAKLHSFWDSILVEEIFYAQKTKNPNYKMPGWKGYKELADLIIEDQKELATEEISATPVLEWYKEAQALHDKVYIDGGRKLHPTEREYCQHLIKDANGKPEVDQRGVAKIVKATASAEATEDYMAESSEIIKSQIMKAGLRLAHILSDMGDRRYLNGVTDYQSLKVQELEELLKEFENKN